MPACGQQAVEVLVEGGGQPGQDVEKPGIRVETVGLGCGQQTHDRGGTLTGGFGASKKSVLAADGDGPDSVLGRVVVDRVAAVVGDARERVPSLLRVADGTSQAGVAQDLGLQLVEPALEDRQLGHKQMLAFAVPFAVAQIAQCGVGRVDLADALDGLLGDRAATGRMGIEEPVPRVCPAAELGDALGEQRLVAEVIVDHQSTV